MASADDNKDYYEILSVCADATLEIIRFRYKKLVLHVHPDKNKNPDATKAFQQLQNAYDTLCDPELRSQYDTQRRNSHRSLAKPHTASAQDEGGAEQAKAEGQKLEELMALQAEWVRLITEHSKVHGDIERITAELRELQEMDEADLQKETARQGLWRRILRRRESGEDKRARDQERLRRLHNRRFKEPLLDKHRARLNSLVREIASVGSQIVEAERLIKAQQAAMEQKQRKARQESEQMQAHAAEVHRYIQAVIEDELRREFQDMKRRSAAARLERQAEEELRRELEDMKWRDTAAWCEEQAEEELRWECEDMKKRAAAAWCEKQAEDELLWEFEDMRKRAAAARRERQAERAEKRDTQVRFQEPQGKHQTHEASQKQRRKGQVDGKPDNPATSRGSHQVDPEVFAARKRFGRRSTASNRV